VTVTSEHHSESTEGGPRARDRRPALPAVALATQRLCPYLVADGFGWRSAAASRDHRCGAVSPPVPLSIDKQRRLCVVSRHTGCPTYLAASEVSRSRDDENAATPSFGAAVATPDTRQPGGEAITRWSIVRTVPVLLDRRGISGLATSALRAATTRQTTLIGVLTVAFVVIAFSRLTGGAATTTPNATLRPTAVVAAASSTDVPEATPAPSTPTSPSATVAPVSATPRPTLPPTVATANYTVKHGDTLWAIARQFHTSVATIQRLNGMGAATRLHAGDVLKVPAS
jgi:LysM repeat protein